MTVSIYAPINSVREYPEKPSGLQLCVLGVIGVQEGAGKRAGVHVAASYPLQSDYLL